MKRKPYVSKKNDLLVIFSDGISEAMNSEEEEFGEEALMDLVKQNRTKSPEQLVEVVFDEIKRFAGKQPQMDDMTMIILKRIG